jgi:hypothetical protein
VSCGARGGARHQHAPNQAHALEIEGDEPLAIEKMTSFARSTDPCTSIVTTLRPSKDGEGGAFESASRLGKLGQPRGTYTEVGANGRSAARRVSTLSQGRQLGTSEKEGDCGLRPCEDHGPRLGCPHVVIET